MASRVRSIFATLAAVDADRHGRVEGDVNKFWFAATKKLNGLGIRGTRRKAIEAALNKRVAGRLLTEREMLTLKRRRNAILKGFGSQSVK